MKKVVGLIVLGIGGLAAAIALTVGALALAGSDVGSVVQPALTPSESGSRAPSPSDDRPSSAPSPSVDDHGGDSVAAGSDDHSGSGSSGSGSSGSGSSGSDSGDSDSHDDD